MSSYLTMASKSLAGASFIHFLRRSQRTNTGLNSKHRVELSPEFPQTKPRVSSFHWGRLVSYDEWLTKSWETGPKAGFLECEIPVACKSTNVYYCWRQPREQGCVVSLFYFLPLPTPNPHLVHENASCEPLFHFLFHTEANVLEGLAVLVFRESCSHITVTL